MDLNHYTKLGGFGSEFWSSDGEGDKNIQNTMYEILE